MLMISRLDRATNVHGGNIRTSKRAIVHDLFYARAGRGDARGKIGETTGTIADDGGETAKTSIGNKAALDHATQDIWIDISAGKQKNNALTREFL